MTLIDAALSRARTTLSILVLLLVTGFATYLSIPKEAEPDINIPIIYVSMTHEGIAPEDADYVLVSETIELPRVGKIGVTLDTSGDRLVVSDFSEDSAAKDIGILSQDRIVELDGKPIASLADLKVALIDKRPGDVVSVKVERVGSGQTTSEASFSLTLR